jgi:hypothetical protein
MAQNIQKLFNFLEKLDLNLLVTTRLYEDKHDITKLKNDLYKYIISFKKEKSFFKINHINNNKFKLLFFHYLKNKYLYINIDFLSKNDIIFFIYNDINIISINGEILDNITENFLLYINEKERLV